MVKNHKKEAIEFSEMEDFKESLFEKGILNLYQENESEKKIAPAEIASIECIILKFIKHLVKFMTCGNCKKQIINTAPRKDMIAIGNEKNIQNMPKENAYCECFLTINNSEYASLKNEYAYFKENAQEFKQYLRSILKLGEKKYKIVFVDDPTEKVDYLDSNGEYNIVISPIENNDHKLTDIKIIEGKIKI